MESLMKKDFFYKKIKDGETKKTFLLGMLFSFKKKYPDGYVDCRLFGLWKVKKKNHVSKYFIAGIYIWKRNHIKELYECVIKIRDRTELQKKEFEQFKIQSNIQQNHNLINTFLAKDNISDLFYIQTCASLFIFSKKLCSFDTLFFRDFFLRNAGCYEHYDFKLMPYNCRLYREHINSFKNENALLFKYIRRNGLISKSLITCSFRNNDLFIESEYLGKENYQVFQGIKYQDTPKRKISQGVTLMDCLKEKTEQDRKKLLTSFFDWLFSEYRSERDENSLKGLVLDCHLNNFLVRDDQFLFIDKDVVFDGDIPKNMCLWWALEAGEPPGYKDSQLYAYFTELYGLEKFDTAHYCHPLYKRNENLEKAAVLNKELLDKYFTERYFLPEYD